MTHGLSEDAAGRFSLSALSAIYDRCQKADVALGPGLGRSDDLVRIVHDLWQTLSMPAWFLTPMRCGHLLRMRSAKT